MTRPGGPPGPGSGLLGMAHVRAMKADMLGFAARLQREYGDSVSWHCGPMRFHQFTHPDQIAEVLVKKAKSFRKPARFKQVFSKWDGNGLVVSDGEYWARQRRLVAPAFHPSRIATYAAAIEDEAATMLAEWSPGRSVAAVRAMHALTLQIACRTFFGTRLPADAETIRQAVDEIQMLAMWELTRLVVLPDWVPHPRKLRGRRAVARLLALVEQLIAERRANPADRGDLLSMLLLATEEDSVKPTEARMTDRQARDEAVTLLLAGHETTATTLIWTLSLLAWHPAVQDEVAACVLAAAPGRAPTFADWPKLGLVEATVKESMRVRPGVYFTSREVAEPVEIGGYRLLPGSQVHLLPYLVHHDPRWWPEPERFDPRRFLPEHEAKIPPLAYIPFGAGPRACIGRTMALTEVALVLARILARFRIRPGPGREPPVSEQEISLHPQGEVELWLEPRHEGASSPAPIYAAG